MLVDLFRLGFDLLKVIEFDFTSFGLPVFNLYHLFWGFVVLGFLFALWERFGG